MECVLCIKRRIANYDKTGKVVMTDLHTQCVAGEVETADINVYMNENTISISGGLEKMLSDAMNSGPSLKIQEPGALRSKGKRRWASQFKPREYIHPPSVPLFYSGPQHVK